jgi:glucose-1-phosphate thymidylyltransferase
MGGSGTRLHPLTLAMSKQMMPVYDKPMIYYHYPLMMAGIHEILIISTPLLPNFKTVGRRCIIGCRFSCRQAIPNGLAQAFVIGKILLAIRRR